VSRESSIAANACFGAATSPCDATTTSYLRRRLRVVPTPARTTPSNLQQVRGGYKGGGAMSGDGREGAVCCSLAARWSVHGRVRVHRHDWRWPAHACPIALHHGVAVARGAHPSLHCGAPASELVFIVPWRWRGEGGGERELDPDSTTGAPCAAC